MERSSTLNVFCEKSESRGDFGPQAKRCASGEPGTWPSTRASATLSQTLLHPPVYHLKRSISFPFRGPFSPS